MTHFRDRFAVAPGDPDEIINLPVGQKRDDSVSAPQVSGQRRATCMECLSYQT